MTDQERREAARQFHNYWYDKGEEKQYTQKFWIDLLQNVYGVDDAIDYIDFEKKVTLSDGVSRVTEKYLDGYIGETKVLIEQKSSSIDLGAAQAGHGGKTPYQQAKEYNDFLPADEKVKWIILCNFKEFWIYNMNDQVPTPNVMCLDELQTKYSKMDFLVKEEVKKISEEEEISTKAGELVGKIYDAFLSQYRNPESPETLKSLNKLCVRLVFCLYAEDAGIFGEIDLFHKYLERFDEKSARKALLELFKVLDQKEEEREPYLADDDPILASFPYVNGGLFADEDIEIPPLTEDILRLILDEASDGFDWSAISPTIFGAVFESTLNPETRHSGGMHYTSIENIHKVIDPLFLDELRSELDEIKKIDVRRTRIANLKKYQEKLAGIKWMDPACGSGNFLTETYICVRKLENEVIQQLKDGQQSFVVEGMEDANPIKVSISQFYGIEINDFAVTVAKTALWIAESQMMKETENIVLMNLDFLPLKTNAYIVEDNALVYDWSELVAPNNLSYIMGNPPFLGSSKMGAEQKRDVVNVLGQVDRVKSVDYVGGWYHKAATYIKNTKIKVAFVSTNSVTQGEQVAPLWSGLFKEHNIEIIFCHRTFKWISESNSQAHVHCVIIGFQIKGANNVDKCIYEGKNRRVVDSISPYLIQGEPIIVKARSNSICNAKNMTYGNKPADGGNLLLSEEEALELMAGDEKIRPYVKRYVGSRDFINNDEIRYCLWLKDAEPSVYTKNRFVMNRLQKVREMREKSSAAPTRAMADAPYLFFSAPQAKGTNMIIPEISGESRRHIPMGFIGEDIIASNKLLIIPNADLYDFGVLSSSVHMAWVRVVAGRMGISYQYSGSIVYNNFPWPTPTEEQKELIKRTAQNVLDVRKKYPNSSLADLYNDNAMPRELSRAITANDIAVMKAYGFDIKATTEEKCVEELMKLYKEMTSE